MVASLKKPFDSIVVFEAIYAQRTTFKPFYSSIKADWLSQINDYENKKGDPSSIKPLDLNKYPKTGKADKKATLNNLYHPANDKEPHEILRAMRFDHGLLFCPCCGEDGSPGTLDHYLPRDAYPELSIVVSNLTPMCADCQKHKSSFYITNRNKRIYIHPYFDIIDNPLVDLKILTPYGSPRDFIISVSDGLDPAFAALVGRHLSGISFFDRFQKYCWQKHVHLLKLFADERLEDNPVSARDLIKRFLKQEKMKAENGWGAIFYRAVLLDDDLIAYLDSGDLPKNF